MTANLDAQVKIYEVGPRDGLQNEPSFLPTRDKLEFIRRLAQTGVQHIEVGSFVSPKKIPQLQDTAELFPQLPKRSHIEYSALIPNLEGYHSAQRAGVRYLALFTAASESFNQHNIHCSIEESLQRFEPIIQEAKAHGDYVRAYVSCALGCPYEGAVAPENVAQICESLLSLGVDELSLADTIGVGTPKQTQKLLQTLMPMVGSTPLALHFHDTYGQALANILKAWEMGIQRFDSAVAGLGGCPYAPGASGNVATEDLLYFFHGMGIETGIDIYQMCQIGDWICQRLKRRNQSKVANALLAQFNHPDH